MGTLDGSSPEDDSSVVDTATDASSDTGSADATPDDADAVSGRGCDSDTACDDGIDCTRDTCIDGACDWQADDTRCTAPSEFCDIARGCLPDCGGVYCNVLPPACGCDEGEGCYPTFTGSRICAPEGMREEAELCTGSNGCRAGLWCGPLGGDPTRSICHRLCRADADCAADAYCYLETTDRIDTTGDGVCTHACNPVTSAPCPSGTRCLFVPDPTRQNSSVCTAPGAVAVGEACAVPSDCQAGLGCVDASCRAWCEVGAGGCGAGETCRTLTPPAVIAGVTYGACL